MSFLFCAHLLFACYVDACRTSRLDGWKLHGTVGSILFHYRWHFPFACRLNSNDEESLAFVWQPQLTRPRGICIQFTWHFDALRWKVFRSAIFAMRLKPSKQCYATYPALVPCRTHRPPFVSVMFRAVFFPLSTFGTIASPSSSSHCISMPFGLASDLFKLGQQLLALRGNHCMVREIPNPFELKRAAVRKIGSVADNILFPLFFNGEDTATKNELRSQANILCCLRFSRKFECFSSGVFSFFLYFVFVNFLAHTHNNKFCIWQLSARRERHKVYVVRERKTVASTEKTIEVTCICSYTVWCVHCSVQSMPPPINSSRCDRLPVAAARCYLIYGSAGEKLWTYRPGKK